jgi:hypothetical protein
MYNEVIKTVLVSSVFINGTIVAVTNLNLIIFLLCLVKEVL